MEKRELHERLREGAVKNKRCSIVRSRVFEENGREGLVFILFYFYFSKMVCFIESLVKVLKEIMPHVYIKHMYNRGFNKWFAITILATI